MTRFLNRPSATRASRTTGAGQAHASPAVLSMVCSVVCSLVRPAGLTAALAVLLTGSAPGEALAHAALLKAEPARRATLSKPPQRLRLWFNERLEPAYATVNLSRKGQGAINVGLAKVDEADPKLLVLELPPLVPGVYTVKYRVLSVDGHTVDQGYSFTVRASAPGP
jgi:methionine-rich copper-binding protein CopC